MARIKKNNRERAERARTALQTYNVIDDGDEAIVDLLADLRHFCQSKGYDFEDLSLIAAGHYEDEAK